MSTIQESRGSVILPSAAATTLREGIAQSLMDEELSIYQRLVLLMDRGGADKNPNGFEDISSRITKAYTSADNKLDRIYRGVKPLKTDYLITKKTDKSFSCGGLSVSFIDEKVKWAVDRDKRAHEDAISSFISKKLFELLADVEWTRGTGGAIRYHDEYMDDREDAEFRQPEIVISFGPIGKDMVREQAMRNNDNFDRLYRESELRSSESIVMKDDNGYSGANAAKKQKQTSPGGR